MSHDITIPSELLLIILSHVPADCLLRFRCVCKAWSRWIDDPYFIKIHTERIHDRSSSNDDVIHFLHINHENYQLRSLSLNLLNSHDDINSMKFGTQSIIPHAMLDRGASFVSCNGLILTYSFTALCPWSIRNPLTQEIHYLPTNDDMLPDSELSGLAIGFGYDCVTSDYKVVQHLRTFYRNEIIRFKHETSVYSLKSNSWKEMNVCSYMISHWTDGVFYNGALHWIGKRLPVQNGSAYMIVAFDLETEDIRFYSMPASIFDGLKYSSDVHLSKLGGCLSFRRDINMQKSFEIWLMNDYGDGNSWSKLFSYENWEKYPMGSLRTLNYSKSKAFVHTLSYSKSKEFVHFRIDETEFILVDLKNRTNNTSKTDLLSISDSMQIYDHQIFLPSIVRINGANINHGY